MRAGMSLLLNTNLNPKCYTSIEAYHTGEGTDVSAGCVSALRHELLEIWSWDEGVSGDACLL